VNAARVRKLTTSLEFLQTEEMRRWIISQQRRGPFIDDADAQAAGDLLPGYPAAIPVIVECSVVSTPGGGLLPTATIQERRRDGDDH